jgi:RpiB/LacA/LacB family sugar-phosphate isomerase
MRIAIGSDHAGFDLKEEAKAFLLEENHEILDVGTYSKAPVDYPDYAEAVATALREYRAERGIILCGSGVGASMAANRIPGIRAGLCHDTYSAHQGVEHDVVMASCGDVATQEALAATAILREHLPDLKVRFVNVVDLFRMQPATEHPHGSTEREFDRLFTLDRPIIFNFHGYPWLIHKLAYRFRNHDNLHVRGYKEKGNINTPLELAILNQVDRFNLVIDVIDRVPRLQNKAAHLKELMKNEIIRNLSYAHEHGTDRSEISDWTWPG